MIKLKKNIPEYRTKMCKKIKENVLQWVQWLIFQIPERKNADK